MPGTLHHPVLTSCLVLFLGGRSTVQDREVRSRPRGWAHRCLYAFIGLLHAQTCEKYEDRCSQCLSASAECVWCADEVLDVS